MLALTKAGGVVERQVVHHSGTKEAPPEEEILSSLLHRPTALLSRLLRDTEPEPEPIAEPLFSVTTKLTFEQLLP